MTLLEIPLAQIEADHHRNDRVALDPEELRELADSIRAHGLINPITVTEHGDRYRLVAGYRRHEACRLIGWQAIPALVAPPREDADAGLRLAENLIRVALSPVEEARAVQQVMQQHDRTPEQVATQLGRSRAWVVHRIALANYPAQILEAVHLKRVSLGVADELALVRDPAARSALLDAAINNGCTVQTAQLWRTHANANVGHVTTAPTQPAGPHPAGKPATVLKDCFACDQPTDMTAMSALFVCPACLDRLTAALHPAPATPQPHPPETP